MTTLVIIAYVPKSVFLASLIFPRVLRPRFASLGWNGARMPDIVSGSHNRVESPRFAHHVGLASDLHDLRSPPTCQMTHMIVRRASDATNLHVQVCNCVAVIHIAAIMIAGYHLPLFLELTQPFIPAA